MTIKIIPGKLYRLKRKLYVCNQATMYLDEQTGQSPESLITCQKDEILMALNPPKKIIWKLYDVIAVLGQQNSQNVQEKDFGMRSESIYSTTFLYKEKIIEIMAPGISLSIPFSLKRYNEWLESKIEFYGDPK